MTIEWDVSPASWSQLWHARVSYLLAGAGVDHVMIKGQTWSGAFHLPDAQVGDVDVLVPPSAFSAAVGALQHGGLQLEHGAVSRFESAVHSVVLREEHGPQVDLHDRYPGLDRLPEETWSILARHVVPATVAGVRVPVLDVTAQALICAASVARDGANSVSARRLAGGHAAIDWTAVAGLAAEVGAGSALRAALETIGHGDSADQLELPAKTARWRLVQAQAPPDIRRVRELLDAAPLVRWRMLMRDVLPRRPIMALIDPSTVGRSRPYLIAAHLRRWRRIVRRLPGVVRTLWRLRRDT